MERRERKYEQGQGQQKYEMFLHELYVVKFCQSEIRKRDNNKNNDKTILRNVKKKHQGECFLSFRASRECLGSGDSELHVVCLQISTALQLWCRCAEHNAAKFHVWSTILDAQFCKRSAIVFPCTSSGKDTSPFARRNVSKSVMSLPLSTIRGMMANLTVAKLLPAAENVIRYMPGRIGRGTWMLTSDITQCPSSIKEWVKAACSEQEERAKRERERENHKNALAFYTSGSNQRTPSAFNPNDYRFPMATGVSRKIIFRVV